MEKEMKKEINEYAERFLDRESASAIKTALETMESEEIEKLFGQTNYVQYFKSNGERLKELIFCLYQCGETLKKYRAAGISDEIFYDTFLDIRRWSDFYRRETGEIGIAEIDWFDYLFQMKIFNLGGLEFEVGVLGETNGFHLPAGKVVKIHIPAGIALDEKNVEYSFEQGKNFIASRFPEYSESPVVCESWMLWTGLKDFLSESSHILAFQNLFHIVSEQEKNSLVKFVFGKSDVNAELNGFECKTSLQKKLLAYKADGGKFKIGFGVLKNG